VRDWPKFSLSLTCSEIYDHFFAYSHLTHIKSRHHHDDDRNNDDDDATMLQLLCLSTSAFHLLIALCNSLKASAIKFALLHQFAEQRKSIYRTFSS